jgi:TolA-binding protein
MNCQQVKAHLVDYLYGELPPELEREVEDALDQCPECAAELAQMREVHELVAALPRLDVPAQVHQNILREARLAADTASASPAPRPRFWTTLLSPPALATALLLCLVLGVGIMLQQQALSPDRDGAHYTDHAAPAEEPPTMVAAAPEDERAATADEPGPTPPPEIVASTRAREATPPATGAPTGTGGPEPPAPLDTLGDPGAAQDPIARLDAQDRTREPEAERRRGLASPTPTRVNQPQDLSGGEPGGGAIAQNEPPAAGDELYRLDEGTVERAQGQQQHAQVEAARPAPPATVPEVAERRAPREPVSRERPPTEREVVGGRGDLPPPQAESRAETTPPGPRERAARRSETAEATPRSPEPTPAAEPILAELHGYASEESSGNSPGSLVETPTTEPQEWRWEQSLTIVGTDVPPSEQDAQLSDALAQRPPPSTTAEGWSSEEMARAAAPPSPDANARFDGEGHDRDVARPDHEPGAPPLARAGEPQRAEEESEGQVDLDLLYRQGLQRYNDGSYREAIQYFSLLMDNAPRTTDFHDLSNFYQGQALIAMGEYRRAAQNFLQIDDPSFEHYEEARLLLARSYEYSGELEPAEDLYNELRRSQNVETNVLADEGLERIQRQRARRDEGARPDRALRERVFDADFAAPAAPSEAPEPANALEKPVPVSY